MLRTQCVIGLVCVVRPVGLWQVSQNPTTQARCEMIGSPGGTENRRGSSQIFTFSESSLIVVSPLNSCSHISAPPPCTTPTAVRPGGCCDVIRTSRTMRRTLNFNVLLKVKWTFPPLFGPAERTSLVRVFEKCRGLNSCREK